MAKARRTTNDQEKAKPPPTNLRQRAPIVRQGSPKELPLDLIEEDPYQPRTVFDPQLLQELAHTVHERGVKNPISIRNNPEKPGHYIINDGARRYRASKLAGKKTIPAFIDPDFTKIDQIIVNAHHADFTPREWAILIDLEEKKGKQKIQIAKELGKSPPFITYYSNLLKLPELLAEVFNSGRCEDVSALTQLLTVWKLYPNDVALWLEDPTVEVTRQSIRRLRQFLDGRTRGDLHPEFNTPENHPTVVPRERKRRTTNPFKLRKPVIQVRVDHRVAHLLYCRRPSKLGKAWIKYLDDGEEKELSINDIQFIGLIEGE